jgi:hypothetical protein
MSLEEAKVRGVDLLSCLCASSTVVGVGGRGESINVVDVDIPVDSTLGRFL